VYFKSVFNAVVDMWPIKVSEDDLINFLCLWVCRNCLITSPVTIMVRIVTS